MNDGRTVAQLAAPQSSSVKKQEWIFVGLDPRRNASGKRQSGTRIKLLWTRRAAAKANIGRHLLGSSPSVDRPDAFVRLLRASRVWLLASGVGCDCLPPSRTNSNRRVVILHPVHMSSKHCNNNGSRTDSCLQRGRPNAPRRRAGERNEAKVRWCNANHWGKVSLLLKDLLGTLHAGTLEINVSKESNRFSSSSQSDCHWLSHSS
jgi:hypothetical protein